jgi:hypothetical protein
VSLEADIKRLQRERAARLREGGLDSETVAIIKAASDSAEEVLEALRPFDYEEGQREKAEIRRLRSLLRSEVR